MGGRACGCSQLRAAFSRSLNELFDSARSLTSPLPRVPPDASAAAGTRSFPSPTLNSKTGAPPHTPQRKAGLKGAPGAGRTAAGLSSPGVAGSQGKRRVGSRELFDVVATGSAEGSGEEEAAAERYLLLGASWKLPLRSGWGRRGRGERPALREEWAGSPSGEGETQPRAEDGALE